jgi:hypothetical protein
MDAMTSRVDASSTPSLLDLADPMVFEARHADDPEMMAAFDSMQTCAVRFSVGGEASNPAAGP